MDCDSSESSINEDYDGQNLMYNSYKCFSCVMEFNDFKKLFDHLNEDHNIDIRTIIKNAKISDDYEWIKFVNYFRCNKDFNCSNTNEWCDDKYLQPVLNDDNLLLVDIDEVLLDIGMENICNIESKETELLKHLSAKDQLINTLRNKVTELMENQIMEVDNSDATIVKQLNSEESAYFNSYSHYSIHDTMIKDKVRTESYRKFIEDVGCDYFKDKVVLDVGCGTGILSIFAARAGAKHVYGVDYADIIYNARVIVDKNGLKDKITLIRGKLEEITLPVEKVDVVISEWMGYFLIYESMLDSVVYACNRYLTKDGHVFPRHFNLIIAGASLEDYRREILDCWDNVYGIDMSCMKPDVNKEVIIDVIPAEEVITETFILREYDVQAIVNYSDILCRQTINRDFQLICKSNGTIGGLVMYFDTYFLSPSSDKQVYFSTGPQATPTHWKQSLLVLDELLPVIQGQILKCHIVICRHKQGNRGLEVKLTIDDVVNQRFEFN